MSRTSGSEYQGNEFATAWQPGISSPEDRARVRVFDSQRSKTRTLRAELALAASTYGAFEWVALGYLAISSTLIVFFAGNLAHPLRLLSVQMLVALLIMALCRAEANVWTPISTSPTAGKELTPPPPDLTPIHTASPPLTHRF